jgi:L-lactate dehydrogenase complex protein LldG
MGVDVAPYDRETGAEADLGITCPIGALATTGSLVQDCSVDGSRGASLLPTVHLALVSRRTIVASTTDLLWGRTSLPSNLVFITGPSRTGDIEMIITVGVHGPVAVHVALVP